MATVQKGAKINFYKFVQVKEPSGGAAAAKTDSNVALTKAINTNTRAINNLGDTVNSLAKIIASMKKIGISQLELQEKNRKKFEAQYATPKKEKGFSGLMGSAAKEGGSFLDGLFDMLGGLFKIAVVTPALEWLGDPKNQKKIKGILDTIVTIGKFIWKVASFGVVSTIEGLYTLLSDESSPWEKVGGLVEGLTGLGTLLLSIRWLSNPSKIITDFGGVLKFFWNNLLRGKKGLLGRAGALGLLVGGAALAYGAYKSVTAPEEKAEGGKVKYPERSGGGWIRGPQSGYKVSLDGGRNTSFIGHGTEYVARKANGGAFVVPFNTPATARQPHLTSKRISEARSQGYKLPGFAEGGAVGRPWWDKFGWFGGAAAEKARQNPTKDPAKEKVFKTGADTKVQGAGLPAVTAGGKWALSKGFTVAEHPNFKKNNWSASGPNTGVGYNKDGGERVGGHSSGSLHYSKLAIDVTDWRKGNWKARTAQLAEEAYNNRKQMKLSQIIHDGWGSWFAGGGKRGPGAFGHPEHLHLGFAKAISGGINGTSAAAHGYGKLLDLIGKRESDSVGGFNAVNQGGADGGHTALGYSGDYRKAPFNPSGKALTDMTIAEIMALQHDDGKLSDAQWKTSGKLHAVGRYQFIGSTLKGLINEGVAKRTDKFSPEIQNKLAAALLKGKSVSQLKGTWIGLQHETDAAVAAAISAGGDQTGAGFETGAGYMTEGGSSTGTAAEQSSKIFLGKHSERGFRDSDIYSANTLGRYRERYGYDTATGIQPSEIKEIKKITEERNQARTQINERTREMMSAALQAVGQQNGVNAQLVAAAQQQISQISARSAPQQPQFIPTQGAISGSAVGGAIGGSVGAAIGGTTAAVLNSFNNPLKGIFR